MTREQIEDALSTGQRIRGVLLRSGGWIRGGHGHCTVEPHAHIDDYWIVRYYDSAMLGGGSVTQVPSENILAITLEP
jgi:hypothetical protein